MRLPVKNEFVRHHGTLVRVDEVQPPPPPKPQKHYIFEQQEAKCELRFNGGLIKGLKTLNDFYGLGTAVKSAIEEMKEYAIDKGISEENDLEVVVVKVISQFKAQPLNKENFYDKDFFDFERMGYLSTEGLDEPVESVVWSSKGLIDK